MTRPAARNGRVPRARGSVIPVERTGLLLVNLGTPASPAPADVRPYLREFLMDPRVLDVPWLQRWIVVHAFILPVRPKASGHAYASIWTEAGSPLLVHSRELAAKVQERLGAGTLVELGMRYGRPSIGEALGRLREAGIARVVVFPLYPQYSSAATGSSIERVCAEAGRLWNTPYLQVVPPFWDHPAFLAACESVARPVLERARPERVFFSFHGLPERQVVRSDPTGAHCLRAPDCCERPGAARTWCYRAQCVETARRLADRLGVAPERRVVCFQSRLGRTPWLRPYTDQVLVEHARAGVRRAVILSPAFVADCLETLEELGIRGAASWRENGGELLELVPAVNATDAWADAVVRIAGESTRWLAPPAPSAAAAGS